VQEQRAVEASLDDAIAVLHFLASIGFQPFALDRTRHANEIAVISSTTRNSLRPSSISRAIVAPVRREKDA